MCWLYSECSKAQKKQQPECKEQTPSILQISGSALNIVHDSYVVT